MAPAPVFKIESRADTLVITPYRKFGSPAVAPVQAELQEIMNRVDEGNVRHVVFDLDFVPYLASSMIEVMLLIWKRIRPRAGRLAVCNASETAKEILELSGLPDIWSICDTCEDAITMVQSGEQ